MSGLLYPDIFTSSRKDWCSDFVDFFTHKRRTTGSMIQVETYRIFFEYFLLVSFKKYSTVCSFIQQTELQRLGWRFRFRHRLCKSQSIIKVILGFLENLELLEFHFSHLEWNIFPQDLKRWLIKFHRCLTSPRCFYKITGKSPGIPLLQCPKQTLMTIIIHSGLLYIYIYYRHCFESLILMWLYCRCSLLCFSCRSGCLYYKSRNGQNLFSLSRCTIIVWHYNWTLLINPICDFCEVRKKLLYCMQFSSNFEGFSRFSPSVAWCLRQKGILLRFLYVRLFDILWWYYYIIYC